MSNKTGEFKGLRSLLWPIHTYELKKFLPTAFIMFFILFNYTIFRNTKDVMVIGAAGAGVTSFLKTYCVTPVSILFVVLYFKATNIFNDEKIFYAVLIPFLAFFALFGFVLNPNIDLIQPSRESVEALILEYPRLSGFLKIYQNWCYSLFYVMAELWGSMCLSLAFWQFVNRITKIAEAKRFYAMFVIISNLSGVLAGKVLKFCAYYGEKFGQSTTEIWNLNISLQIQLCILSGIIAIGLYYWMHRSVLTDSRFYEPKPAKAKKSKPGLVDSFKIILKSKELLFIVMLPICYGITINLVELQWKNQVGLLYNGNKNLMSKFFAEYVEWTGWITMLFALIFGANILRRLGWVVSAMFTPITVLSCGAIFFGFIFFKDNMSSLMTNPVYVAVIVGAIVVVSSKAAKYCLFDSTKEMAYIPLDDELKSKGKAAVDVIGGRLGKAGGALSQSLLFMVFATTNPLDIVNIAVFVFIILCVVWVYVVKGLGKRLKALDSTI